MERSYSVTALCTVGSSQCISLHTDIHNLAKNSLLPATLYSSCGESHEGNAPMLAAFISDPHSDVSSCGFAR